MVVLVAIVSLAGCAFFRHEIISQENSGPHGGALVFIDKRLPEFVELVAVPGERKWTFQVFSYNRNLEPRTISGSAYLEITLPGGEKQTVGLWNTKRFIWSRGVGHLENKLELGSAQEFSAVLTLSRSKRRHKDYLNYIYSNHTLLAEKAIRNVQE